MATKAASERALAPIAGAGDSALDLKRWIRRAAILLVAAAAVVALRVTYFQPAFVPVSVVRVGTGLVEEIVTNNKAGTITARRRAMLSPEIGGRLARLPVKAGDQVRRGDVLLALSDADLRAQIAVQDTALAAARSTAVEACAAADLAARELDRATALAAAQLISRQTLDQAESRRTTAAATCTTSRARVEQALASLDLARVNLTKAVLVAPFDGVIARTSADLGEWITPSPPGMQIPAVIELFDPGSIHVRAPLDEVDAGKVLAGLPVRITMDAFPGRTFPGRLTYVAAYVSEAQQQNRTFDIEVSFDDGAVARTLLPGSSADVEIVLRVRDDVVRVPTSAILQGGRVLVVRDETLVAVPIRTGLANWEVTEVVEGVTPGDRVVISLDRIEVREGARVRVTAEVSR